MKRFFRYILYSLFVIILLIAGLKITLYLRFLSAKTFSSTPSIIAATFFPLFLGFLLACPFILNKFRKPGKFSIDWIIIFSVCIPSLFINMSLILAYFSPLGRLIPDLLRLFNDLQAIAISGLVFIFSLLYSFKKVE